jgi:hypothetical protein
LIFDDKIGGLNDLTKAGKLGLQDAYEVIKKYWSNKS